MKIPAPPLKKQPSPEMAAELVSLLATTREILERWDAAIADTSDRSGLDALYILGVEAMGRLRSHLKQIEQMK
jgi:hypothetical protein